MRVIALSLMIVVLAALPSAAAPTTVQEDACGGPPSAETGVVLPGQDMCSAAIDTVVSDGATTLLVTLTLAGDPAQAPSAHAVSWAAGDCGFVPFRSDHGGVEVTSGVSVTCGDRADSCTTVFVPAVCEPEYDFEEVYDVQAEVGENQVTWTIPFDGELADFADLHLPGQSIRMGLATAGTSTPVTDVGLAAFRCGTETGCGDVVGDFMTGGGSYTIGS